MLARCSGDNYFPMINALFAQQSQWARAERPSVQLFQIAKLAGFTEESFNACFQDNELLQNIRKVRATGQNDFNVRSTPTLLMARVMPAICLRTKWVCLLRPRANAKPIKHYFLQ